MGLDRQKTLKAAEKYLSQGKNERGVHELQKLAQDAADDPLTINRIGDLLARHGLCEEAIGYYSTIGAKFVDGGFLPKAIAIYKKIYRLSPDNVEALMRLGMLYLKQKLPGEARGYLLSAADSCLERKDFAAAKDIYQRLVVAEPDVPSHRARLAESMAADGDKPAAAAQLVELGNRLLSRGEFQEAERSFKRAQEWMPDSSAPLLGISHCLQGFGRKDESFELLREALAKQDATQTPVSGDLLGELALRHERDGDVDASMALLQRPESTQVANSYWCDIFRHHLDKGSSAALWDRMAPLFNSWSHGTDEPFLLSLLEDLTSIEEEGHLPALQWLSDLLKAREDRTGQVRILERLAQAYEKRSMLDEAGNTRDQIRKLAPSASVAQPSKKVRETVDTHAADAAASSAMNSEAPPVSSVETPAVPLEKSDEAFVSGRLTQAEILEKYGLLSQAIEQVAEVVGKFPGHVDGQERMVLLQRGANDPKALATALVGLATATRASGDWEKAVNAAEEALQTGHVNAATRKQLETLGLLTADAEDAGASGISVDGSQAAVDPTQAIPSGDGTSDVQPAQTQALDAAAAGAKRLVEPIHANSEGVQEELIDFTDGDDSSLVIDFDDADESVPSAASTPEQTAAAQPLAPAAAENQRSAAAPGDGVPNPEGEQPSGVDKVDKEVIAELEFYVEQGMLAEAQSKLAGLRQLGLDDPALDAVAVKISSALASQTAQAPVDEAEVTASDSEADSIVMEDLSADDDLSELTAALESELFEESLASPEVEETEQSVEEVFAQFRECVAEQVDSEDYRTHYDLGIAYKEMGLMDEAIDEFQLAVQSEEKLRDSCVMLAQCFSERNASTDAVGWYRKALDAPGGDRQSTAALQYELGNLLQASGSNDEALDVFRTVLQVDPSFRDVQSRIEQIEAARA